MTRLIWSNDEPPDPQPTTHESSPRGHSHQVHALCAGERAPDFRLPDQHGRRVTLSALAAKGPVVLRFCRYRDMMSCFRESDGLAPLHLECEERGATLAVIAEQPPHLHPADEDPAAYAFLLLTDKGAKVARSFGLTYRSPSPARAPAMAKDGDDALKLPHRKSETAPATYIVDQRSIIALAFVDVEGRTRMEKDEIVMALDCLAKKRDARVGMRDGADASGNP